MLRLAELRAEIERLEADAGLVARVPSAPPREALGLAAYQLIAEHATDVLSIHAPNGDYLFVSPGARPLLGYDPSELVGTNAYRYFHPDDLGRIAADHAGHGAGAAGAVRYRLRRRDGHYRWVETRSRSHHTDGGPTHIVAITRDIDEEVTARGRLTAREQQTVRAEQAAAAARLAHALAHELNNPLAAAVVEVDILSRQLGTASAETLGPLRVVLDRLCAVSAELLMLSSTDSPADGRADAADVCRRVVRLLGGNEQPTRLTLEPSPVETDLQRLYQLVHHMLTACGPGAGRPRTLACAAREGLVEIVVTGIETDALLRIRADLVAAVRGDTFSGSLPLMLASRICAQLGGVWEEDRPASGGLVLRARLPRHL